MKVTVVGIQSIDYVSKKTGQPVQGASVQFIRPLNQSEIEHTKGRMCGTEFISAKSPMIEKVVKLNLDTDYEFVYEYDGRFTSLVDIRPVKA